MSGIPDETTGEAVKAYIVLREGETATPEEIIEFVPRTRVRPDRLQGAQAGRVPRLASRDAGGQGPAPRAHARGEGAGGGDGRLARSSRQSITTAPMPTEAPATTRAASAAIIAVSRSVASIATGLTNPNIRNPNIRPFCRGSARPARDRASQVVAGLPAQVSSTTAPLPSISRRERSARSSSSPGAQVPGEVIVHGLQEHGAGPLQEVPPGGGDGQEHAPAVGRARPPLDETGLLHAVGQAGQSALAEQDGSGHLLHPHRYLGGRQADQDLVPGEREADLSDQGALDRLEGDRVRLDQRGPRRRGRRSVGHRGRAHAPKSSGKVDSSTSLVVCCIQNS